MYKYKEKTYAESILNNGFNANYLNSELKILAKYYKFKGYKPKEREEMLYEFCEKHVEDFSKVLYFKKINSTLNYARKKENALVEIDNIDVTVSEINKINSMEVDHLHKKILFTIMVLDKLNKKSSKIKTGRIPQEHYFGGSNTRYKELLDSSKTSLSIKKLHIAIGELAEKNLIQINNRGFIKLLFMYDMDDNDDVAIKIDTYDNIGLYYDLYMGLDKVKQCENCNTPIKVKSNRTKYCKDCWEDRQRELWRHNKRKQRNVQV